MHLHKVHVTDLGILHLALLVEHVAVKDEGDTRVGRYVMLAAVDVDDLAEFRGLCASRLLVTIQCKAGWERVKV